jgi:hypothetical protein
MAPQIPAAGPTTTALVAHEPPRTPFGAPHALALDGPLLQQGRKDDGLMPLPRAQEKGDGLAVPLGPQVDFGAEAALTAASRCRLRVPFLAPAACWWARMIVLSTQWIVHSNWPAPSACCCKAAKMRWKTPAFCQR